MVKLTKEEKAAKKVAMRLEKVRQQEELRKQTKRDALQREITAQKKKRAELDKHWREMMLKIKEPIFYKDMEVMWYTFERAYDKKEHLIRHILYLIETAEDQFHRTISGFCEIIDGMIKKFLEDLDDMAKDNVKRVRNLRKWGEYIINKIMADHNSAEMHLQVMIFHADTNNDQYIWNTRGKNMAIEEGDSMSNVKEAETLRSLLENKFSTIWDEYKATLKTYFASSAENSKHLRKLRRKDHFMADIIAAQARKLADSESLQRRLRMKLNAYETGEKQAVFRERRRRHRAAFETLRAAFTASRNIDEVQLATLVQTSNESLEWLEAANSKGEKVLKAAAMCRKFETRREKVLPFGFDTPHGPMIDTNVSEGKQRLQQTDSNESLINEAMASVGGLHRLWQKISKAELIKRALMREKDILTNENRKLKIDIEAINERPAIPDLDGKRVCPCEKMGKQIISRPAAIEKALKVPKYRKGR